jgi:hypothetical protein
MDSGAADGFMIQRRTSPERSRNSRRRWSRSCSGASSSVPHMREARFAKTWGCRGPSAVNGANASATRTSQHDERSRLVVAAVAFGRRRVAGGTSWRACAASRQHFPDSGREEQDRLRQRGSTSSSEATFPVRRSQICSTDFRIPTDGSSSHDRPPPVWNAQLGRSESTTTPPSWFTTP